MEKLLKEAELHELLKKVTKGEITFSKMCEIINLKHLQKLTELRYKINGNNAHNTIKRFKRTFRKDI